MDVRAFFTAALLVFPLADEKVCAYRALADFGGIRERQALQKYSALGRLEEHQRGGGPQVHFVFEGVNGEVRAALFVAQGIHVFDQGCQILIGIPKTNPEGHDFEAGTRILGQELTQFFKRQLLLVTVLHDGVCTGVGGL